MMAYSAEQLRGWYRHSGGASIHLTNTEAREIMLGLADLIERHAKMRDNLKIIQFADHGYCPACGGWNADPNDPKRGCTPKMHTKDCWLAAAIADFPKEG